jgi:ABC-type nickel/cobalt efflux system permease component RcnA
MTWLVLVLPATFAEVIVLEIRSRSYRGAQLFIGFMYLMAFVNIWILRAWKVRELRNAQLTEKERARAIHDDDAATAAAAGHKHQHGDGEDRPVPMRRVASVASTAKNGFQLVQGLWAWERV